MFYNCRQFVHVGGALSQMRFLGKNTTIRIPLTSVTAGANATGTSKCLPRIFLATVETETRIRSKQCFWCGLGSRVEVGKGGRERLKYISCMTRSLETPAI